MDFSQFNTKTAGEEGRFLHLRHLRTNAPLYETKEDPTTGETLKEPVGIWLRSIESTQVLEAVQAFQRRKMKGETKEGEDKDTAIAQALVVKFQNVERDDGNPLTTSPEDLTWFFDQSILLVQACVEFARDLGNFIAAESTNKP